MRCDVNISLKEEGSDMLGTRTEIKNMNSVSFIEKAMAYEAARQAEILDAGGKIEQATMRFDESTGETYVMRTKEDAQDYRYFPEPDLLTVNIPQQKVEEIAAALPELPLEKLRRYTGELGISAQNAHLLYKYKAVCDFFDSCIAQGAGAKNLSNLILGTIYSTLPTEEEKEAFDIKISAEDMAQLVKYVDGGKINITLAQMTLSKMLKEGGALSDYISETDLAGVSEGELEALCREEGEEEIEEITLDDVREYVPQPSAEEAEEAVPEGMVDEAVEAAPEEPAAEHPETEAAPVSAEKDESEELPYE